MWLRAAFVFAHLAVATRAVGAAPGPELIATVVALEAEHQSVLPPPGSGAANRWSTPVLDNDLHLFSWRVQVHTAAGGAVARNVTQVSATLTLSTDHQPPVVCHPKTASDLTIFCGSRGWRAAAR